MKAPPGPGPAKYDRVFVQQLGPKAARTVLVLVPGTNGGAGGITPVAREIVRRVPKHAGLDRRPSRAGARGHVGASGAATPSARRTTTSASSTGGYWGGREVRGRVGAEAPARRPSQRDPAARAGGRRVLLGGHSAGASTAVAYAAWDFGGRAGYRDLDGLVLIDGGLLGSFQSADLARARTSSPTSAAATSSTTCSGSASPRSTGSSPRSARSWPTGGRTSHRCSSSTRSPRLREAADPRVPTRRCSATRSTRRPRPASSRSSTSTRGGWRTAATRAAGRTAS